MDEKPADKNSELFMGLVTSLQESALIYLGKFVQPGSKRSLKNLEAAAASIDMLDMLMEKTRGNLNPEEARFLRETVSFLKLNYVDEVHKSQKQTAKSEPSSGSPESTHSETPPSTNPPSE
jgi:hypothetical protein